jgi:hypothetical protein
MDVVNKLKAPYDLVGSKVLLTLPAAQTRTGRGKSSP